VPADVVAVIWLGLVEGAARTAMAKPESPRRRGDRVRQTILEWLFPIGGTVVLLIAVLVAIFWR